MKARTVMLETKQDISDWNRILLPACALPRNELKYANCIREVHRNNGQVKIRAILIYDQQVAEETLHQFFGNTIYGFKAWLDERAPQNNVKRFLKEEPFQAKGKPFYEIQESLVFGERPVQVRNPYTINHLRKLYGEYGLYLEKIVRYKARTDRYVIADATGASSANAYTKQELIYLYENNQLFHSGAIR